MEVAHELKEAGRFFLGEEVKEKKDPQKKEGNASECLYQSLGGQEVSVCSPLIGNQNISTGGFLFLIQNLNF
jgi:hypothetical protein